VLFGKTLQPVTELHAGDIGAVAKLKDALTGDTLDDKSSLIAYPHVDLPEPSIAFAISAKTRQTKTVWATRSRASSKKTCHCVSIATHKLRSSCWRASASSTWEIVVSRLKRRYGVDVALHAPKIPYRETIRSSADVQGRHKKQTGGHGQFGDCKIRMEPLPRGERFQFVNEISVERFPGSMFQRWKRGLLRRRKGLSGGLSGGGLQGERLRWLVS